MKDAKTVLKAGDEDSEDYDEVLQRNIEIITGQNVKLKPADIDLNQIDRITHTPKHGQRVPEDQNYFENVLQNNSLLQNNFNSLDKNYKEFISK